MCPCVCGDDNLPKPESRTMLSETTQHVLGAVQINALLHIKHTTYTFGIISVEARQIVAT